MIKSKKYIFVFLTMLTVFGAGLMISSNSLADSSYIHSTTPTFFFHGSGSSYHAEQYMTNAAKRAGVTHTIVVANVDQNDHVTFHGKIKAGDKNPIIEVNHQVQPLRPTPKNMQKGASYAYAVIHAKQKKWHFKTMNIVAHSAGNIDVLYLLLDHKPTQLPQLKKQVAIAAHVNGFIHGGYPTGAKVAKNGLPSKEDHNFSRMKALRQRYPYGVKVLNIYGDLEDGSHSDGVVPVNSARTLRYLVGKHAASYQEKEFFGANARHSKLHHNPKVNRILINFLWRLHQ